MFIFFAVIILVCLGPAFAVPIAIVGGVFAIVSAFGVRAAIRQDYGR